MKVATALQQDWLFPTCEIIIQPWPADLQIAKSHTSGKAPENLAGASSGGPCSPMRRNLRRNAVPFRPSAILTKGMLAPLLGTPMVRAAQKKGTCPVSLRFISGAKVSLSQAVVIARQNIGGRAFHANLEDAKGSPDDLCKTKASSHG